MSYRNSHTTYVTNLSICPHNPFREVESATVRQHLLNCLSDEPPIFGVYEAHIFLNRRCLAARIKAVDLKQFGRPIIESSSVERPAAHVSKPLSFGKVEVGYFPFFKVNIYADPILL